MKNISEEEKSRHILFDNTLSESMITEVKHLELNQFSDG